MSIRDLQRHKKEFLADLLAGDFEMTDEGLLFVRKGAMLKGAYMHRVNGGPFEVDHNLIVDQGILYAIGAALCGSPSPITAWYLALYATAVTPVNTWTAANFASNSGEITSNVNGFSQTVRPTWTPGTPASDAVDNTASLATWNIVTSSSINVNGAGLLSSNTLGGTTGTLFSSGRFGAQRVLYNGDVFQLGYQVSMTGS